MNIVGNPLETFGSNSGTETDDARMTQLELNKEQTAVLRDTLDVVLSNMNYEIAKTDQKAFRDELKNKRDLLQEITNELKWSCKFDPDIIGSKTGKLRSNGRWSA